ncbi:hypothetical protein [Xanthobacter sp.]|uniref:hypothetical protein n=1 Tax=Xanthobacter sp. TaxID=35809 RepID=UPI0035B04CD2
MNVFPVVAAILIASGSSASAAPKRDAPPSAAEINDAISRSVDFRGTVVRTVLGCVPSGSEDGVEDPKQVEWYCAVDGNPLPSGETHIEIALRRLSGPRKFNVIIGELVGVCPPASSIAGDLGRLSKTAGVTKLLTGRRGFAGSMVANEAAKESAVLECGYLGQVGRNTYQLTVRMTYDATGYHVQGDAREEQWDSNGKLVELAR